MNRRRIGGPRQLTQTQGERRQEGVSSPLNHALVKIGFQLVVTCLLILSQNVSGEQYFRSRAELERWEQRIRSHIQMERTTLDRYVRSRNESSAAAARQTSAQMRDFYQNTVGDYDRKLIPACKQRIADLENQLAHPPPVIDEEERAREAERQRQQELNRLQQESLTRQREQRRQSEEQYRSWQENRQKESDAQFERQRHAADLWGKSLGNALQEMFKAKPRAETDPLGEDVPSSPPRRRFAVTDPTLQASSSADDLPKSRVVGNLDQIMQPKPLPEPARRTDSLGGFLTSVTQETASSVVLTTMDLLTEGNHATDPFKATYESKSAQLAEELKSLLNPEQRAKLDVTLSLAKGDFSEAYDQSIELLPENRRLEARAARLPVAVVTRDLDERLMGIWDKEVVPRANQIRLEGVVPPASPSPHNPDRQRLVDISKGLLEKSLIQPDTEPQLQIRRDLDEIGMARVIGTSREQSRKDYEDARTYWEKNGPAVWQTRLPWATSEAEAQYQMKHIFQSWEHSLEIRDRLLDESAAK